MSDEIKLKLHIWQITNSNYKFHFQFKSSIGGKDYLLGGTLLAGYYHLIIIDDIVIRKVKNIRRCIKLGKHHRSPPLVAFKVKDDVCIPYNVL